MGPLRRAATRNLPGEGRFTVSQISVTALSFSNSAVNIRRAITARAQKKKRLLLIDCTACCYSTKNVLLIFCFHQIFHLKYESGNEAVSCINKDRQSCCFAFGSAAPAGTGARSLLASPAWVLQDPVPQLGPKMILPLANSTQRLVPGCNNHEKGKMGLRIVRPTPSAARKVGLVPGGLANIKKTANTQQNKTNQTSTVQALEIRNVAASPGRQELLWREKDRR